MPEAILSILVSLYGDQEARDTYQDITRLIKRYRLLIKAPASTGLSERDAILIAYGDQVRQPGSTPLKTLTGLAQNTLRGIASGIHLLPFFPYSSDDGFSVIDYRQVDPELGDWEDIRVLGRDFRLMFDAVINHCSVNSVWFRGFLQDQPPYRDYFIAVQGHPDLSQVARPRALPLLTEFDTRLGKESVWTTFSVDQVDLNYKNPRVLLEILEVLLFYVSQGAQFLRLDAIAYLWKEIGTSCIHLPQTHRVVQLFRSVLDQVAPYVRIITETNVPHPENISYFGDGSNEAQMVYNFALPPLVLHTFRTGKASALSRWATGLMLPSDHTTFFNFLASHDGIGVTPALGLISGEDLQGLIDQAIEHQGLVSYRSNPDGSQSPYELNINYFDALSNPMGSEPLQVQIDRFVAAHAILFSFMGVPGVYFHSLFGSRGWLEGVKLTGRNRTINRQKLNLADLLRDLLDPHSLRACVYQRLAHLLQVRAGYPAFHPSGKQEVLELDSRIFALIRFSPDGKQRALCLQNVSNQTVSVQPPSIGMSDGIDLIGNLNSSQAMSDIFTLEPYQSAWLALG
jgi:sucrose phosphorylase